MERDGTAVAKGDWDVCDELTFERDVMVGMDSVAVSEDDKSFYTINLDSKPMRVARWCTRKDGEYNDLMVLGVAEVRDGKLYWCEGPVRRVAKEFKTGPGDKRTLIVARAQNRKC